MFGGTRMRRLGSLLYLLCLTWAVSCSKPEQPAQQTSANEPAKKASSESALAKNERAKNERAKNERAKNERATRKPAAAPDPQQIAHGRELYTRICAVCHGANGEGYKADNATALNHPAFLGSVTDAFLREAIAKGRAGSTMSAWSTEHGGPLDAAGIDAVIALMRSWYTGPKLELDDKRMTGNRERGGELYAKHCARCHGATGIEGPYTRIGDRALLRHASNGFLRLAIRDGRKPTPMEGFASTLGPDGIEDVVAHLRMLPFGHVPHAEPATPKDKPLRLPKLPLHPKGPEPVGFLPHPAVTPLEVIAREHKRGARMALLDARAPADYLREHIKDAASVPYYDPSPYLDKLPKDVWLVAYCACPHAESKSLAQKLVDAGFPKVTVLDDGIGVWKAKGHPTVSAPKAKPAAPAK